jgi:hypothetical protein
MMKFNKGILVAALLLFSAAAQAQTAIPLCNRISAVVDSVTQQPLLVFTMFAHDMKGSVSCRAPASRLQTTYLTNIYLTLYWERSYRQFPFIVRIYNARTGEVVQGQNSFLGKYSTVDFEYNGLALNGSDDLIIEVTSKSGKAQYVGMGGNIWGAN